MYFILADASVNKKLTSMNWKSPCLSCDWWLTGNAFIWLFFKGSFHLVIAIIMIDSSIKCNFYSWFLTLRLCVIARCSVTIFAFRSKLRISSCILYAQCTVSTFFPSCLWEYENLGVEDNRNLLRFFFSFCTM